MPVLRIWQIPRLSNSHVSPCLASVLFSARRGWFEF